MRYAYLLLIVLACGIIQRTHAQRDAAPSFPNWIVMQGPSIDFYFQDTTNLPVHALDYLFLHETAYSVLNETFDANLPQRIRLYVWTDQQLARKLLGSPLGFADPAKCVCNIHPRQTRGHEMTHVLSYWAWGTTPRKRTRFINEGLATAFDLSGRAFLTMVRDSLQGSPYRSILEVWENGDDAERVSAELLYPAGAAFIQHLRKAISEKEFRELVKEQTIEHMRAVLGKKRFKQLVADFDAQVWLK